MVGQVDELVERLQGILGDDLRSVAVGRLDRREYEIGYMREDISEAYSEEMREEIFREAVLERLSQPQQSELFPELGEPHSTIRLFDNGAYVLYWGSIDAAFVAFDPDETLIPQVIDACERTLDGIPRHNQ